MQLKFKYFCLLLSIIFIGTLVAYNIIPMIILVAMIAITPSAILIIQNNK